MQVSVRTLESQAVLAISAEPSETIGAFKKRAAATLPYSGVCRFMLRVSIALSFCQHLDPKRLAKTLVWIAQGQYLSRHVKLASLDLLAHEFLVSMLPGQLNILYNDLWSEPACLEVSACTQAWSLTGVLCMHR